MRHIEADTQRAFIKFVRQVHPNLLYTIAPINKTGIREAVRNKAMGYTPGTPDVIFFEPRGQYHGLLIEFKAPDENLIPSQRAFLQRASDLGYKTEVCFYATEAVTKLESYLWSKKVG